MDILRKARSLESKIASGFDRAAREFVQSGTREPIEIVHSIVEAVEKEVQSSGRGKRVFPFNRITLMVLAPSRDARARFEAVAADEPPLRQRIVDRLGSAGCRVPGLVVDITYVTRAPKGWENPEFHIEFERDTKAIVADVGGELSPARVELTVLRGVAEQRTYSFVARRIDLGRRTEVRDSRNRLLRTNHVAFVEGTGANESVSRQHAHIMYESSTGDYRLYDDGSGHGTGIARNDRTLPVPRGSRGVRLQSGDEIVLGEARVRIRFDLAPRR
jgi:pSer/pThr/pTyr-binding forkhead associated (FHA) protein